MTTRFGSPPPGAMSAAERHRRNKRRWQSSSDEEIERNLDRRNLAYRHGWPQLPPLPVSTCKQGARNLVSQPEKVIENVQSICRAQRLEHKEVYFAFRTPEITSSDENYLTLVVTADLSSRPILVPAIIQIRKALQQDTKNKEIYVEVIDYRVVHGLYSFAIPPSEESLLRCWESIYDAILTQIHVHKESWLTIEMLYRGVQDEAARCPATVVITSSTAAEDIWTDTIIPRLRISIRPLDPHLQIELLCGSSAYAASEGCAIDAQAYNQQVTMGTSIGHDDLPKHSGTVGGMVRLSNGKSYALTNHHVVRNELLDKLLEQLSRTAGESCALKPGNPLRPTQHRLNCPSNEDHDTYMKDRREYEQQWLQQIRSGNTAAQQYLDKTQAELNTARQAVRGFGTVHASSGLRTVKSEKLPSDPLTGKLAPPTGKEQYRFMLDWSLLDIRPGRSMTNALPMRPLDAANNGPFPKLMSGQVCTQWTTMNNPSCHILRDEVPVGKFGRTTAWTFGYINAIPTVINPVSEMGQFKFIAETYGLTVKDCGVSMSMVGHKGPVVGLGDSGSVVLHAPSGKWLGLLFGETRTKAALITPIDMIFRDIKEVTGFDVVEPAFTPNW